MIDYDMVKLTPRLVTILLLFLMALAACTSPDADLIVPSLMAPPEALPDVPVGRLVLDGDAMAGELNSPGDVDVWQFQAPAGERITLETGGDVPVSMVLQTLAGDELGRGQVIEAQLDQEGIYTVLVRLAEPTAGSYNILLRYTNPVVASSTGATEVPQVVGVPTPTPPYANLGRFISNLTSGEEVTGELTDLAPNHIYTFSGASGSYAQLAMSRISGTVDPVITLYSPSGNPVAMDDNSGGNRNALLRNIRLPENGLYSLQVNGDGASGAYSLSFTMTDLIVPVTPETIVQVEPTGRPTFVPPTMGPAVRGARLNDHVPVIGRLNRASDFDQFSIFATAGEVISLGVSPIGELSLRPKIEVYDPESNLIASATAAVGGSGIAAIPPFPVPVAGAYLVFVTGEDGTVGNYTISYGSGLSRQDTFRGEAVSGSRNQGQISEVGLRDVWQIYLNKGDVITAAVSPDGVPLDPYLEFTLEDGTVVVEDDNGGGGNAALIRAIEVNESGIYNLRVRDAGGTAAGPYTLVWRYINLAPTSTPVPNAITLMTVDDSVPEGVYRFYVFQGRAGQQVRISVVAKPGSPIDPVAVLLDPQGREIAQGDDSDIDLNPRFTVTLPVDGTYTVRVNGYLSGGAFDAKVELLF